MMIETFFVYPLRHKNTNKIRIVIQNFKKKHISRTIYAYLNPMYRILSKKTNPKTKTLLNKILKMRYQFSNNQQSYKKLLSKFKEQPGGVAIIHLKKLSYRIIYSHPDSIGGWIHGKIQINRKKLNICNVYCMYLIDTIGLK